MKCLSKPTSHLFSILSAGKTGEMYAYQKNTPDAKQPKHITRPIGWGWVVQESPAHKHNFYLQCQRKKNCNSDNEIRIIAPVKKIKFAFFHHKHCDGKVARRGKTWRWWWWFFFFGLPTKSSEMECARYFHVISCSTIQTEIIWCEKTKTTPKNEEWSMHWSEFGPKRQQEKEN